MKILSRYSFGLLAMLALIFSLQSQAAEEPQIVVEKVAKELFALANSKNEGKITEENYFSQTEAVLDKVVAFRFIASNVMGSEVYKKATPEQQESKATPKALPTMPKAKSKLRILKSIRKNPGVQQYNKK